jgi:hypothetical protein
MEIARVRSIWYGWSGAPGVTVMYFRKRTSSSWGEIAQQIVAQVAAAWAEGSDLFNTNIDIIASGDIDILNDATGELLFSITGNPSTTTGSGGTYAAPPADAVLVRYLTDDVYRGHRVRGGTYLAPVSKLVLSNDGTLTPDGLSAAEAFADSIRTSGSYVQLQTWSRPKNAAKDDGQAFDVTGKSVSTKLAILRSRRD